MAKALAEIGKTAIKKGGKFVFRIGATTAIDVRAQAEVKVDVRANGRASGSGRATIHGHADISANFGIFLENEDSRPRLVDAVNKGFGYNRKDQKDPGITKGSLRVTLHCLTDERFLKVLDDYNSGEIKKSLGEEFENAGFKVEGLKIEIENMGEVRDTKEAITKRY